MDFLSQLRDQKCLLGHSTPASKSYWFNGVADEGPERLHHVVRRERITMCGFHPTAAMLVAARELGAASAELVGYATSGDITKDYASVVGYAGLVVR